MSKWYITTDILERGGKKVMGPFESQELAIDVRTLLEFKIATESGETKPQTFWVDEEKQQSDV